MTKWIELREKIRKIYGKHNRLILAVVKFILALFLFLLINHYVGYMEKLHHVYIAVALALICAMLPVNMTVLVLRRQYQFPYTLSSLGPVCAFRDLRRRS